MFHLDFDSKLSLDSKRSTVLFFRINADENDLPWELFVSQYPSFLLFPAYRYSEIYWNSLDEKRFRTIAWWFLSLKSSIQS